MVIVGLNTSIPLEVGLNALREALEKKLRKPFQWRNIENSRVYVLKKYSQFCNETRRKILRMGLGLICPIIRLDFLRPYFKLLAGQHLQPLILFRWTDDTFFIWNYGTESLKKSLWELELNSFGEFIKFTHEHNSLNSQYFSSVSHSKLYFAVLIDYLLYLIIYYISFIITTKENTKMAAKYLQNKMFLNNPLKSTWTIRFIYNICMRKNWGNWCMRKRKETVFAAMCKLVVRD